MNQIVLVFFIVFSSQNLLSKEIAITFDDSPRFASNYFNVQKHQNKIIYRILSTV
jgi:hypothetical protein